MNPSPRLTFATGVILQAIAEGHAYGFDIMDTSGLPDGTVYPALRRLERADLLESQWEDQEDAHERGRPARRYYRLTPGGMRALATARERFPGLRQAILRPDGPEPQGV